MITQPLRILLLNNDVVLEDAQITFLPLRAGMSIQHPVLAQFALTTTTATELAVLLGALTACQRQECLITWSALLTTGVTHRMRGILRGWELRQPTNTTWQLSIDMIPV